MTAKTDLVTVTIDDVAVQVKPGTLIIRAAEQAGVYIPRFCDHPLLDPVGACRQCLVDVASPAGPEHKLRAFPKPQPACTMVVTDGMVVHTGATSEAARKAQTATMELILGSHPLDCPICDKGGECPLQNQAMMVGRDDSRFSGTKRHYPKPLPLTANILLDRERCVLCQRCTRFAAQIPADPFIGLQGRGAKEQIGRFDPAALGFELTAQQGTVQEDEVAWGERTVEGQPFASYFSGNIVQICPVGALTSADYRFRSRPFDLVSLPGVAEHDSSGSAIRVDLRRGRVLRRLAAHDDAVNQEWLSDKDRFAFGWQTAPDRLTAPLIRDGGELREASWPEAIAAAAAGLAQAAGVGVLPGGRLTLEDALAYSVFARRVLHTDDVDYRSRPHSAEETAFLASQVAGSGLGVTFEALTSGAPVVMAGFEPEDEGGIVFLRLREAVRKRGAKVFSIAPFASVGVQRLGGELIPALPGGEAAALTALTEASPAGAALKAADGRGVIVVGERLALVPGGLTAALAAAARLGAKLAWIPRRAGERAAIEAGLLPGLLPGGRRLGALSGPDAAALAPLFGTDLPAAPGRDASGIVQAVIDGQIGALVVGGVDPDDMPAPAEARIALDRAFVVSLDVRRGPVAQYADVVLPVAPPLEKAGTFINWEGRLRPFGQGIATTALADGRVLARLAQALGVSDLAELGKPGLTHDFFGALGAPAARVAAPAVPAAPAPVPPGHGQALLATWRLLLDAGSCQDQAPHLAATQKLPVALVSPGTAQANGLTKGGVEISTGRGAIVLPLRIAPDMLDGVVWAPANSGASRVLPALGACGGAVTLKPADTKEVG
ncbi:MAG: NADH-quinone oxidoreductase subunit G [Bifidobacteriaceae bacterium]|nr:NADH-quinone oxidoreductase subunit G [Bifidobacteriaceae bacterium]